MHPITPVHTMLVLHIAQQAVMQTFLAKGLFLLVAPLVLPTVSIKFIYHLMYTISHKQQIYLFKNCIKILTQTQGEIL